MERLSARATLAVVSFSLPLLALVACGVDGKTPDCQTAQAGCEPSAENANPTTDARADGTLEGGRDGATSPDSATTTDGGADSASDAKSDGADAKADAKLDADAKTG